MVNCAENSLVKLFSYWLRKFELSVISAAHEP